jgi:serine protease Do
VGIGFATPSVLAQAVLSDIRKYGRARRGWLGVQIQTVTQDIADSLGMDDSSGALVVSVVEDGPAQTSGIEVGDVVLEFNGRPVKEMRRLPAIVAETEINIEVPVVVWRDGKRVKLKVTVGEMADEDSDSPAGTPEKAPKPTDDGLTPIKPLGLTITPLTDDLREQFGLPDDVNGLVVMEIKTGGPAAEQNIQPGDVIAQVGRVSVTKAAEVMEQIKIAEDAGHKSVLLLIKNATSMHFVSVSIEGKD